MTKLLQLNVTANWGSTGKIVESIGVAALNQGWDSYIAYGRWSNPSQSRVIKVGRKVGMYLHYFEQRIRDNEGLCSRFLTKVLIRKIQVLKPDIVHLHNIHDHWLNYKLLFEYLNQTDIKVVWTFHDFWPITGHCMHFTMVNCDRFQTGCHDCPMRRVYPKVLIDNSSSNYELKRSLFTANKNLTVVAVSRWVGEMVKKSFLKDKPIHVINNGVNTNVFRPTSLSVLGNQYSHFISATKGKFVILAVASQWKVDKGLDDYISMASLLRDDEMIVLVGLEEKNSISLPSNVYGLKRTTSMKELAALYSYAGVVTILSRAETFGLTVLEGFSCGTPAVVYNNTAPPALIISNGYTITDGMMESPLGIVVPNYDFRSAYKAIQRIRSVGKKHFSSQCIDYARKNYDESVCVEKYINLYKNLIS